MTITGYKHRYHIDKLIAKTQDGDVYRAYVLRKSHGKLRRHYYALVEHSAESVGEVSCATIEECFDFDNRHFTSFVRNERRRKDRFVNKGFLMILLSILLLLLVIFKFS